ncbi:MAG: FAD-binding oxidoreductase, partial [Bacillota bacterium]
EPSCTSVFKQELRELLGFADEGARQVAEATWDVMAYLGHLLDAGALAPGGAEAAAGGVETAAAAAFTAGRITLHAHCHQKSLGAHHDAVRVLEALTGLPVDLVDAGCCGMAGSFGYKREHYDFSARIAERVRQGVEESGGLLVTTGTSCTAQLADLFGWRAYHPLEILAGRGAGD